MRKLRIFAASEMHIGEPDKPNEDAFMYDADFGLVVLADGITRLRSRLGKYPHDDATVASTVFCHTIKKNLVAGTYTTDTIKQSMVSANNAVLHENNVRNINSQTVDYKTLDYLGTTGMILGVNTHEAILTYLADSVAIHIPCGGRAKLLTKDQLHSCNVFCNSKDRDTTISPEEFKRKLCRNKFNAFDAHGNRIGFGAFTGEPEALPFLETVRVSIQSKDIFLLASDAIRAAIETDSSVPESIASYKSVIDLIASNTLENIPKSVIELIRTNEATKKLRSDDATVLIIEVQ